MPVIRGPISVRRYRVRGELPRDVRSRFLKGIRAHAFEPIDPQSSEEAHAGWVSSMDEDQNDIQLGHIMFGDRLVVAMRFDTLNPPPKAVKKAVAARARAMEAESGNPVGRRELRMLKVVIETELKARMIPKSQVTDMAWDLGAHALSSPGRLYLWATSKSINERFLDLFAKTFGKNFGLELDPETPGRWAADREGVVVQPTREFLFGFQGTRPGLNVEAAGANEETE